MCLITEVDPNMPTVRDPDRHMYIREWSGGVLAGCFEIDGRPCFQEGVPDSFEFQLLPEDWDHIRKILIKVFCTSVLSPTSWYSYMLLQYR